MDREALVRQLRDAKGIDDSLLQTLRAVAREVPHFALQGAVLPPVFVQQLIQTLIPLACEYKVIKYREDIRLYEQLNKHRRDLDAGKSALLEQSMEALSTALGRLCAQSPAASALVVEKMLEHADSHRDCTRLYAVLLGLMEQCEEVGKALKEQDAVNVLISYLTGICAHTAVYHTAALPPLHQRRESEHAKLAVTGVLPNVLNKSGFYESDSFSLELNVLHGHTVSSRALRRACRERAEESDPMLKSPRVPMLNLPSLAEGNPSRSSRRADLNKTISTRSGKINGSWGDRADASSPVAMSPLPRNETPKIHNASAAFDFDQSFVVEDTTNPQDYMTPSEKLRNLAIQIGEACLTADLTALIAQKRDSELEQVAKKTLFPVANLDIKRGKPKELEPLNIRGRSHSLTSLISQDLRKEIDKENMQIISKKKEKISTTFKLRATLLTLVNRLLHMYEIEELQTVRSPLNTLFAHVTSQEYTSERSAVVNEYQELGTNSDEEDDLLEDEVCCFPASEGRKQEQGAEPLSSRLRNREEAQAAPGNTVPGNSPRGARPMEGVGGGMQAGTGFSFEASVANESSHAGAKAGSRKNLIQSEDISIFSILSLYSEQTEFTHSQAVSPALTLASTVISSSHMLDSLSPYKPFRSTNVSILPSPQLSQFLEEQGPVTPKDLTLWVEGIGWPNLGEGLKEKLRKHSDMFLWRLSRRLQWAQESLTSKQLFDVETDMFQLLARYLRICRTRVSLFQALDVVCETLLSAKKRIIDEWQGSRPPSPREPITSKSHCCAYLKVLTQLFLQAQTFETFKLLSEVYVNNDLWAECVRVYAMTVLHPTVKDVYEARVVIRYYRAMTIFCRKLVQDLSLDAKSNEMGGEQKQWKQTIRHVLSGFTWLTSPSRGMLPRYLHKNTPESPNSNQASLTTFYRHLPLMKEVLHLIADLLWFSGRFSSFRNEDHSLFYIRMHFISFLKLYTNNHAKSDDDSPSLNATMGNKQLTVSFNELRNSSDYSKSCFLLSKLHLRCLFAYARHRNPDITRKFYQFRILEFLTREIDLEYDISLRRARFLQLRKEEKQRFEERMRHKAASKAGISLPQPTIPEAPSANSSFAQTPEKKPTGFKLNLAGLKPRIDPPVERPPDPPLNIDGSLDALFPPSNPVSLPTGKKLGIPLLKLGSLDDSKRPVDPKSTKTKSLLPELSPSSDLKSEKPKIPALKMSLLTQDPEQKEREKQEFVKSIIFKEEETEENYGLTKLERSLNKRNPKMQLGLDLQSGRKAEDQMASLEVMKEPEFYERERRQREIYADSDLQVTIIGLILCLLLTPTRGTLDELYCYQYPINNGKPNVLFLLHHHLNHRSNQHILPKLLNLVSHIVPTLAGQRLLKLLSAAFFDVSIYSNWEKIATGAYGTVYKCSTGLHEPAVVAIKKMSVPKTIYERCVLHDIFTEISCLEEFRLERCVTDLYDYGVDENDYYIVMKCYPMSLKQWRIQLKGSLEEHLPELLTVYREILKAVQTIHRHNVTHYDLKCDNILFEDPLEDYKITIGDFGECRMFVNADDELCLRNKGTEPIKSPEMLALTIAAKKETEKYDRRRKVGTTRASDIWSLGCLLYELLTGDFLFNYPDWALFFIRVTSASEQLLTEEMTQKINNNVYLIDFLKYLLVRDPRLRPSIDSVLTRFEHLHALLISAPPVASRVTSAHTLRLGGLVNRAQELIAEFKVEQGEIQWRPSFLRITEDVFICSEAFITAHVSRLVSYGITHVVHYHSANTPDLKRFQTLVFDHPFQSLPLVMDFLRGIQIAGGRVLFFDGEKAEVRVVLLLALSELFNASCFETWTLVNSQVFYISLPQSALSLMSEWTYLQSQMKQYMSTFPRYQCLCGSCVLVLKRHLADPKLQFSKACACARQYRNVETSECPSPGCGDYLAVLKHMHNLTWDNLVWGFGDKEDFEIGPITNPYAPIILNSEGIAQNLELARVVEKRWPTSEVWKLYKCTTCHLWVIALNANDSRVAFTMNLPVSNQQGILASRGNAVRVPVLRKFRLSSYNLPA